MTHRTTRTNEEVLESWKDGGARWILFCFVLFIINLGVFHFEDTAVVRGRYGEMER